MSVRFKRSVWSMFCILKSSCCNQRLVCNGFVTDIFTLDWFKIGFMFLSQSKSLHCPFLHIGQLSPHGFPKSACSFPADCVKNSFMCWVMQSIASCSIAKLFSFLCIHSLLPIKNMKCTFYELIICSFCVLCCFLCVHNNTRRIPCQAQNVFFVNFSC